MSLIWSRATLLGLVAMAGILISCGEDASSAAEVTATKKKQDLPSCTDEKEGDTFYVAEEGLDYICVHEEWLPKEEDATSSSSSIDKGSSGETKNSSSSKGNPESSSSFVGNSSSSSASSSSSSGTAVSSSEEVDECPVDETAEGKKLNGYVQLMTFPEGTCVTLRPMTEKLEYKDSSVVYRGKISKEKSSFTIYGLPDSLDIVEIKVKGDGMLYQESEGTDMSIRAIARLNDDGPVFLNVLTEGIAGRLGYLVKQKQMAFDDAKATAETEYLKLFFVDQDFHDFETRSVHDNTSESYWMWAISSLVGRRNMLDYSSLYQGLMSRFKVLGAEISFPALFIYNFYEDGSAGKGAYLQWTKINNAPIDSLTIRQWKIFTGVSGIGDCVPERTGEVVKVLAEGYRYFNHYYCNETKWRLATNFEKDTYGWITPCTPTSIIQGNVTTSGYYCDYEKWVDVTSLNGRVPKDEYLNPNIKYGTMTDERDGKVYKTVVIGGKTWMAQNLAISEASIKEVGDEDMIANVSGNIHTMPKDTLRKATQCGYYYSWSAYMNLPESIALNGDTAAAKALIKENHQGICPDGWHIPSVDEINNIIPEMDASGSNSVGYYLKSKYGWGKVYDDEYGFSLLPCGRVYYVHLAWAQGDLGSYGYLGAAVSRPIMRYYMATSSSQLNTSSVSKSNVNTVATSIRCVKND